MTVDASTESIQPQSESSKFDISLEPAEPEILLPTEKCLVYKEVRVGSQVFMLPVEVKIHQTADEVLKLIPLTTVEETGALLCYKDGVFMEGGEPKVEALLHKSFHGI